LVELKYKKYIVEDYVLTDEPELPPEVAEFRSTIVHTNDNIVKGSFFAGFVWYLKPFEMPGANSSVSHSHDFDELLGFLGSDWQNPSNLNAEIEFWLEDERYILRKSCIIFIPKGLKHCPLKLLKCNRPLLHFGISPEKRVTKLTRQ
jgi:hypothetical protein